MRSQSRGRICDLRNAGHDARNTSSWMAAGGPAVFAVSGLLVECFNNLAWTLAGKVNHPEPDIGEETEWRQHLLQLRPQPS
jgi:hypothetical protein